MKKIKDPLEAISSIFISEVRKNFAELPNICSTCLIDKDLGWLCLRKIWADVHKGQMRQENLQIFTILKFQVKGRVLWYIANFINNAIKRKKKKKKKLAIIVNLDHNESQ